MNKWWQNPILGTDDDEGAYDYYAEELPQDNSKWSWYPCKCDDCGKERRLHQTDTHYFYCWDGWDSMSYTTCWRCYIKSIIKFSIRKTKQFIHDNVLKLDLGAYLVFRKFCKKHNLSKEDQKDMWVRYHDVWHDKAMHKYVKGVK